MAAALPPVTQVFDVDAAQFLAGVNEMTAQTERAAASIDETAAATERLAVAADQAGAADERIAAGAGGTAASTDEAAAGLEREAVAADEATEASGRYVDASGRMREANGRFVASSEEAGAASEESGAKTEGAGSKAKMAFLGIAVGAGIAVKGAMEYQEQSGQLVTGAGELDKNLKMVEQGMLAISAATGTSTSQLQAGMYMIESAGYHGAAGLSVLKAAAEGAQVSDASLNSVADATTTVMTDYGMGANHAADATSGLIAIVADGKTHMDDLSRSMSRVLPTASSLKIPFDQVGGAMATMTAQGVTARLAATHLNSTMLAMAAPSATAAKAMQSVGLSSTQVGNTLTHQGLIAALTEVTDAAGKKFPPGSAQYVAAVKAMLGGQAGLSTALQLTGAHLKTLKNDTNDVGKAMHNGAGLQDAWTKRQKEASFQTAQAKQALHAMTIELGMALLPAVSAILKPLASFLSMIAQNKVAAAAFAVVVGGVLAGAIGGKVVGALSDLKSGIAGTFGLIGKAADAAKKFELGSKLASAATKVWTGIQAAFDVVMDANPIMLVVIAIALIVGAIILAYTHFKTFRDIVNDVGRAIKAAFLDAFHAVKTAVLDVIGFIKRNWMLLLGILLGPIALAVALIFKYWKQIEDGFKVAWNFCKQIVSDAWSAIQSAISAALSFVKRLLSDAWSDIKSAISDVWSWIKSFINLEVDGIKDILHWFSQLGSLFRGWWNDAVNAVTSVVGGLIHFVSGIPGNILSALGDLGSLLYNAGVNVIQGLINGIGSMIGSVGHAISSIAGEITSHLPFSPAKKGPLSGAGSPDKAGQRIARMLAEGMIDGSGDVRGAASHLAGSAGLLPGGAGSLAIPGGAAGGGAGGTSIGPINLTVNGFVGNQQELMQQLYYQFQQIVLQQDRRNVTNGLSLAHP